MASQVFGVWVTPYSDVPPVTVILEELRAPSKFLPLKHFTYIFFVYFCTTIRAAIICIIIIARVEPVKVYRPPSGVLQRKGSVAVGPTWWAGAALTLHMATSCLCWTTSCMRQNSPLHCMTERLLRLQTLHLPLWFVTNTH